MVTGRLGATCGLLLAGGSSGPAGYKGPSILVDPRVVGSDLHSIGSKSSLSVGCLPPLFDTLRRAETVRVNDEGARSGA